MTITINLNDLVLILLNGDTNSSVCIPLHVGDIIRSVVGYESCLHLDHEPTWKYYELYSAQGWQNELARRVYVASMGIANSKNPPREYVTATSLTKKPLPPDLQAQLDELKAMGFKL